MTQAAVGAGRMILGDMCPDNEKHGHGHREDALDDGPAGKRTAPPTCIEFQIAVESPNGYPDAQNRRSFGECRIKLIAPDPCFLLTFDRE